MLAPSSTWSPGQDSRFDDRPGKGGADAQQRPRDADDSQAVHFGMGDANENEPRARAFQDGPGRARFGRIVAEPLGPLGGLQVFGLQGHEVRAVDLGENLTGADPVAG